MLQQAKIFSIYSLALRPKMVTHTPETGQLLRLLDNCTEVFDRLLGCGGIMVGFKNYALTFGPKRRLLGGVAKLRKNSWVRFHLCS